MFSIKHMLTRNKLIKFYLMVGPRIHWTLEYFLLNPMSLELNCLKPVERQGEKVGNRWVKSRLWIIWYFFGY